VRASTATHRDLLDAQLLRTVGTAPYGGADVGECLATAARIDGTNLTSWHDCEAGARTLYHALSFGWLDRVLQPDA
jgi:hypothetical protein